MGQAWGTAAWVLGRGASPGATLDNEACNAKYHAGNHRKREGGRGANGLEAWLCSIILLRGLATIAFIRIFRAPLPFSLHDDPPWRTPLTLPLAAAAAAAAAAVVAIVRRCCCCCSVSCGRRYIIRNLHKINKLNMPDMRCAVGRLPPPRPRPRLDSQSFHFVITRAWDSPNHEGGGREDNQ